MTASQDSLEGRMRDTTRRALRIMQEHKESMRETLALAALLSDPALNNKATTAMDSLERAVRGLGKLLDVSECEIDVIAATVHVDLTVATAEIEGWLDRNIRTTTRTILADLNKLYGTSFASVKDIEDYWAATPVG